MEIVHVDSGGRLGEVWKGLGEGRGLRWVRHGVVILSELGEVGGNGGEG